MIVYEGTAIFIGEDGSRGLKHNELYPVTIDEYLPSKYNVVWERHDIRYVVMKWYGHPYPNSCPYDSFNKVLQNWSLNGYILDVN